MYSNVTYCAMSTMQLTVQCQQCQQCHLMYNVSNVNYCTMSAMSLILYNVSNVTYCTMSAMSITVQCQQCHLYCTMSAMSITVQCQQCHLLLNSFLFIRQTPSIDNLLVPESYSRPTVCTLGLQYIQCSTSWLILILAHFVATAIAYITVPQGQYSVGYT